MSAGQPTERDLPARTLAFRKISRAFVLKTVSVLRLDEMMRRVQRNRSRIVVVAMHETMSTHKEQFRRQLDWAARHFSLITPELFARALEAKAPVWPESKPAVLFTFDDGRECNYLVAAPLLESFGARGIFFVVPEFVGLTGKAARDFYYSRIDIRGLPTDDAATDEIWKPMSSDQISGLVRRGHWVGSHTMSHTRLEGLSDSDLNREIKESSAQIALWTGRSPDAFAWAYSWDAIDPTSWEAVKNVYRLCFSPCPGTFDLAEDSPALIWRKEIESYYSRAEYRFMYSGLLDLTWAGKRAKLRRMLNRTG